MLGNVVYARKVSLLFLVGERGALLLCVCVLWVFRGGLHWKCSGIYFAKYEKKKFLIICYESSSLQPPVTHMTPDPWTAIWPSSVPH